MQHRKLTIFFYFGLILFKLPFDFSIDGLLIIPLIIKALISSYVNSMQCKSII